MKALLIGLLVLGLAACGQTSEVNHRVTGSADLNIKDNLTQCMVRQNGTSLFVMQDGLDPYTFVFDASVTYPDQWITLTIADTMRVTPLTPAEDAILKGLQ